jgi:hypothetical protein
MIAARGSHLTDESDDGTHGALGEGGLRLGGVHEETMAETFITGPSAKESKGRSVS